MRIFKNCVEAISELTREIFSRGIRAYDPTVQAQYVSSKEYEAKELLGYCYWILDISDRDKMLEWARREFGKPHLNKKHAEEWLNEMLEQKATNPGTSWLCWKEYWEDKLEPNGRFSYTYNERFVYLDQVIDHLRNNRSARGAVLTIYETTRDITNMGRSRTPCSMFIHFMIRKWADEEQLLLFYTQRSCDFCNFYPLDVWRMTGVQLYAAEKLNVKPGPFIHYISCLHAFRKDIKDPRRLW